MHPPAAALQLALAVIAAVGFAFDIKSRRLPNWLTLSGLVVGFGLQIHTRGVHGGLEALLGAALGGLVYLGLYAIGAMGAGDVKLMAAVGAIAGPVNWLVIFVYTSLAGGLIALGAVIARGRIGETMGNVGFILSRLLRLRSPRRERPQLDVRSSKAMTLPHGVAIAVGSYLFLILGCAADV